MVSSSDMAIALDAIPFKEERSILDWICTVGSHTSHNTARDITRGNAGSKGSNSRQAHQMSSRYSYYSMKESQW